MRRLGLLVCLLVLASACGGGRTTTTSRLPGKLARAWARQADQVAQAVDAGDSCRATALASSLARSVSAHRTDVPPRYQRVLLPAVDRLANGLTCTVTTVVTTTTAPPAKPPKPKPKPPHGPKPPGHHDHGPGHGHGGDGGDGG